MPDKTLNGESSEEPSSERTSLDRIAELEAELVNQRQQHAAQQEQHKKDMDEMRRLINANLATSSNAQTASLSSASGPAPVDNEPINIHSSNLCKSTDILQTNNATLINSSSANSTSSDFAGFENPSTALFVSNSSSSLVTTPVSLSVSAPVSSLIYTVPTSGSYSAPISNLSNVPNAIQYVAHPQSSFPSVMSAHVSNSLPQNNRSEIPIVAPPGYSFVRQHSLDGQEFLQMVADSSNNVQISSASSGPNPLVASSQSSQFNAIRMEQRGIDYRRHQDLPPFDGRPEAWPLFIGSYRSSTQSFGYSDVENLYRLQKSITGFARKSVESILIYPQQVERVIAELESRFGRPDQLVWSQIKLAKELPIVDDAHLEKIVDHSIVVQNLATYLDTAETQHHLADPTLLRELLTKLPMSRRLEWAAVADNIRPYPTLRDYSKWISGVARLVCLATPPSISAFSNSSKINNAPKPQFPRGKHLLLANRNASAPMTTLCTFCKGSHNVHSCQKFLQLCAADRLREVSKIPLCYSCLGNDHLLPACQTKQRCGIDGCSMWHTDKLHQPGNINAKSRSNHRSSHLRRQEPIPEPSRNNNSKFSRLAVSTQTNNQQQHSGVNSESSTILNCREGRGEGKLFFRVVPVELHGPRRTIRTSALLDEGSSISLIDRSTADELGLKGDSSELSVQWFGGHSTVVRSRSVTLEISGEQMNARRFSISNIRTMDNLTLPTQSVYRSEIVRNNKHLVDIPFDSFEESEPKILIGLDNHHLGIPQQTVSSEDEDGLVAAETKLGWVIYGREGRATLPGAIVLHVRNEEDENDRSYAQLHELVRQHFTTEEFGSKIVEGPIESDDVILARKILQATTKRVGERFETGLLWKNAHVSLPDSYDMALQRLRSVENKMRRDPEYARQYQEQIKSYIEKGYAKKLSEHEIAESNARTWYLPHFAVKNANKPGKFRLVFDAAATSHGVSLNSQLLSGPDVNVPLTRLLFKFRIGTVGVCGDIREMFHQVMIRKEDRNAQRFLWRNGNSVVRPDVYAMQVMTFGSTCSPASAQHVKNVNATDFEKEMPEAALAIKSQHYVDDYVASFASPEDAARITKEVVEVHRRGGFELRGIVSNSAEVRDKFGGDNGFEGPVRLEPEQEMQKILGMAWDTNDDMFRFLTRFNRVREDIVNGTRKPTKREILSTVMSIFDPFGLLADFILPAKLILQELWRQDIGWDHSIPEKINLEWQAWRSLLEKTQQLRVPRCYSSHLLTTSDLQLHLFADASENAFAAVAYWRITIGDRADLAFIAGKVRCAPTQRLSIPRLELQAAVLAARLLREIQESHNISVSKIVLWSDSETVLKWLRSDQRRYKAFVAFRVAEIVEMTNSAWWRWVPTAHNVADDATRVRTPLRYELNNRWVQGPEWLREREEQWPVQTSSVASDNVDEEVRSKFVGVVSCRGPVDYERFSKFFRLCRTVAWASRFGANLRLHREQRHQGELSSIEVNQAVDTICRWVQKECFAREIVDLQSGRPVTSTSRIFLLKPYLDEDGLMRVHGRTDNANEEHLQREAKRPIILPDDHPFTRLLVRHHHERLAHQLVDATIAAVRVRFWVPCLRKLVRRIQHECNTCRLRNAKPSIPSQGQLPKDRMQAYARPFTNTGLDFFGPVTVTIGRRHEKRWVALFTCLTVRAVHLEIAADLSTDACLMCIRNFCNIRGVPSLIRCDNGTNFVGAHNELARDSTFFDPSAIQRDLSTRGVEWRFNCPANPEAGGAWERLVQSVKRVLRVTLLEEAPRVETLRALLLEAANIVNSRPLTHLQVDPNDPEPLTPNHFLLGGPNAAMVPNPGDVEPRATRKQWQISRGLSRTFWRQWVRDYLPEMTRRNKHYSCQPPLEIGDLVIICDENQPRGKWVRGRIENVVKANDGIVRTASVRTTDGVLRRPTTKLARLEVSPSPTGSTDGGRHVANFP